MIKVHTAPYIAYTYDDLAGRSLEVAMLGRLRPLLPRESVFGR